MKKTIKESSTNQENLKKLSERCSVNDTLSFIGKRWSMAILYEISLGNNQFSKLIKNVSGVSEHVLGSIVEQLTIKELIIKTKIEETIPVQISYSITRKGSELLTIINDLHNWTDDWTENKFCDSFA